MHTVQKKRKKQAGPHQPRFAAMQLLNDPNGTAEKVFDILKKSTERFSARVTMMMFVSRLISM